MEPKQLQTGKWVIVSFNASACEYQSSDLNREFKSNPRNRNVVAVANRSLATLAMALKKYRSQAAALQALS